MHMLEQLIIFIKQNNHIMKYFNLKLIVTFLIIILFTSTSISQELAINWNNTFGVDWEGNNTEDWAQAIVSHSNGNYYAAGFSSTYDLNTRGRAPSIAILSNC